VQGVENAERDTPAIMDTDSSLPSRAGDATARQSQHTISTTSSSQLNGAITDLKGFNSQLKVTSCMRRLEFDKSCDTDPPLDTASNLN